MILHRIQLHYGTDWSNEWFGTGAEARAAWKDIKRHFTGTGAHLDKVYIPDDKDGMVELLNEVASHRMNVPGQELERV